MNFVQTRYYGSKRKHLAWIQECLHQIQPNSVLDAFGGTGAMSFLFQTMGWRVTYNDIFKFNAISAAALFKDNHITLDRAALFNIIECTSHHKGFIFNNFEGIYFESHENAWIDDYLLRIENLNSSLKNIMLYALFQACLRKRPYNLFHRANLDIRRNSNSKKFGNKATWNKPFADHTKEIIDELIRFKSETPPPTYPIDIRNGDAGGIYGKFDSIYLDPPYFKRSKSIETYTQRYHFLEGLSRYSEWMNLIDFEKKNLCFKNDQVNEWGKKIDFISGIDRIIKNTTPNRVIMSYMSGEYPSEEDIFSTLNKHFNTVTIFKKPYSSCLSKKQHHELLFIGE